MGSADLPCELCGEFAEFDQVNEIKNEIKNHSRDEEGQDDFERSLEILKEKTVSSSDAPVPPAVPEDRSAAFNRPLHLLSSHCDRDFVIFAALTRSGKQIYDNGLFSREDLGSCSPASSVENLPAKHILAMSSKEGPDGGCGGALGLPGLGAVAGSFDSPYVTWTCSDALSMWTSVTGKSPQTFFAAVTWSTHFNGDRKQCTRAHETLGQNWNSDDYFDPGPIPRADQFVDALDYVWRGYQEPFGTDGLNSVQLAERVKHLGPHPSFLRFQRALDGKLVSEKGLKELDRENYDIALWEFWNDYGNMHTFALRSLFPVKGAYKLRDSFLPAFDSKSETLVRSASQLESLPPEILLQILSSSSMTPLDLLCMGGTSRKIRSVLVAGRRVDSFTRDFIQRSAPWLLPNAKDWWDCGGYENYSQEFKVGEDQEYFQWPSDISVPDHVRGEKLRVQKKRQRESSEQKIWKQWIKEAEAEFGIKGGIESHLSIPQDSNNTSAKKVSDDFPSNFPWLAYYLLATSTRRTSFGRDTNYAYSSSMRNRKRVYHIISNIEKFVAEVEIDPDKPLNVDSIQRFRKLSAEGKERFRSWPEGTPRPNNAQFLTY